jgi:lipopolysaccharide assembly outer membrane protein LptD (OstA)
MLFRVISLVLLAAAWVAAADSFQWQDTHAQFRDVCIDSAAGKIYVAAYDHDEIWVHDSATLDRIERIKTGEGPVALALSPANKVLACANRNSGTVTLLQLPSGALLGEVATGAGPVDVAALADGRFAVANSFADSVSLVNTGTASAINLAGAPIVPIGAAADTQYLALIGRADSAIQFYAAPDYATAGAVKISGTPLETVALGDGRFAVRTASSIVVVDAGTRAVAAEGPLAVDALHGEAGLLYAVQGSSVSVLLPDLSLRESISLAESATSFAAGGNVQVALTPKRSGWQVSRDGIAAPATRTAAAVEPAPEAIPAPDLEPAPAPALTPAPGPESMPAVAEAETIDEDSGIAQDVTPEKALATDAEPTVQPPANVGYMDIAAPAADAAEAPEPEMEVAAAEEPAADTAEQADKPKPTVYTEGQLPRPEIRAPSSSDRRPSPVPLGGPPEASIGDMLSGEVGFDALESALQAPDWTQPLRDIEADTARGSLDTDVTVWEGNVRLRLENTFFQADRFQHTRSTGEMVATGNVRILQGETIVTADQITYRVPAGAIAADSPPALIEATLDEQTRAKTTLGRGTLVAYNIRVVEPFREFQAEYVQIDLAASTGEMRRAEGTAGVYYVFAEHVVILGPQSFDATGAWLTTCASPAPPYRINIKNLEVRDGEMVSGQQARLQLGKFKTPIFIPFMTGGEKQWSFDFDSGREAELGFFLNTGAQYQVTPDVSIGPRLFATEDEGVGFGGDLEYDFMENPASRMFRTRGEAHGIYTTEDRGYIHMYHRYEPNPDLVVRVQAEQWSDEEFYKDFFFDEHRDRTTPRTFANVTYRQPTYIATATVRPNTHSWVNETERLPEASFHLLERRILPNLYLSYDTVNGYNDREPLGGSATRLVHVARLSYDLDLHEALSLTPFFEGQASWYSEDRLGEESIDNFTSTAGVTLQSRLHRVYDGRWGFESFKHVIVPSMTYSYRPDTSIAAEDLPFFDSLDSAFGRSRLETKIDNVIYGKDAESGEVWQVARLSLYQGNDFWNESHKADDYEIELDLRPRPWWGMQLVGERHVIEDDLQIDDPHFFQQLNLRAFEAIFDEPYRQESDFLYSSAYSDYSRLLGQFYYDNTVRGGRWQSRLGYAYTETGDRVFNQELLYGAGYKLSEKWGVGFEHRYDFEDNTMRSQSYEVRRSFQCWESALRVRDRESGLDIDLEFSITALPGAKLKL